MCRIKIKNFGPVRVGREDNEGWIDVKKVTVFIGNQGSGKSTVAKLISTFAWMEKDVFRSGDVAIENQKKEETFRKNLEYHRIEGYLKENTYIAYEGSAYKITYNYGKDLEFEEIPNFSYGLPRITYFPAERNFISSVKNFKGNNALSLWSQSLQEFKEIFQEAKENLKESIQFPINDTELEYNRMNDMLYVKGGDYRLPLSETASGFLSVIPMCLVANYVSSSVCSGQQMNSFQRDLFRKETADILNNKDYTDEQRRILLSNVAARYSVKRTLNIIEEPEQNLYPSSQQKVLYELLKLNNPVSDKMVVTTHSPYIIGYLSLAVKAHSITRHVESTEIERKVNEIIPMSSVLSSEDLSIYELSEKDGSIHLLDFYNGIPSNQNFLNQELAAKNEMYSQLLDLQDLCQ